LARKIPKHPSLDIVGSDGAELSGRKIVLCITGSVAAYKSIELARLLMRHGASVTCVASAAATTSNTQNNLSTTKLYSIRAHNIQRRMLWYFPSQAPLVVYLILIFPLKTNAHHQEIDHSLHLFCMIPKLL